MRMDSINVILTVWKRDNLEKQLNAIQNQTANINDVYVYQNESHIDVDRFKDKYKFKHVHSKDMNFKFHGRFTLPLLFDTKYTAIFDDDTIPNKNWLSHCQQLCEKDNCIVGANCRRQDGFGAGLCDGKFNTVPLEGDLVGHCWFFKTEWIHYMWREPAPTFDNGEDLHFSAACKIHGGIKSYLATQTPGDEDSWGDTESALGIDEHATWRRPDHNPIRAKLYEYWVDKGLEVAK